MYVYLYIIIIIVDACMYFELEYISVLFYRGVYKMYKLSHKLTVIFYNVQKQVKKQVGTICWLSDF